MAQGGWAALDDQGALAGGAAGDDNEEWGLVCPLMKRA
jgi:hypothetical protein